MCKFTRIIDNPKYVKLAHGSRKHAFRVYGTRSDYYIRIPCGKCSECRKHKVNEWVVRVSEEMKVNRNCAFVTLTYADEFLPLSVRNGLPIMQLHKSDIQKFFKRFRKKFEDTTLKYLAVGEYGDNTERPHFHLLLFWDYLPCYTRDVYINLKVALQSVWPFGNIDVSEVTAARVRYTLKYMTKNFSLSNYSVPPFMLASRNPAIGNCLSDERMKYYTDLVKDGCLFCHIDQGKFPIPTYYKNIILKTLSYDEKKKYKENVLLSLAKCGRDVTPLIRQKYVLDKEKLKHSQIEKINQIKINTKVKKSYGL